MHKIIKKIIILSFVACIIMSFISFGEDTIGDEYGTKAESDFSEATFACSVGTIEDKIIKSIFPNAKIQYYNTVSDSMTGLLTCKCQAAIGTDAIFNEMHRADRNVKKFSHSIYDYTQGFLLSKKICTDDNGIVQTQLNEFIQEAKENGFVEELKKRWCYGNTININYEHKVVENPKKILHIGVFDDTPYSYFKNGSCEGFDIEFIETFCEKYNYGIETELTDLSSVLLGVTTSKYDIGIGGITITEERKKNITFSDCYFVEEVHLLYYEKTDDDVEFIDFLTKEFRESFIQEKRYEFLLKGMLNTILITISSVIIGIIVGFILYVIYRKDVAVVNKIIGIYAYLNNYIKTIDKGQIEASYALGYTDNETFFKILLPQAIINIYGSFKDEVVSLLKSTSVVGYIAVEDLTRVGDVIRSRTYKAIFPVISIAVIYFVLGVLFKIILGIIGTYINPRRKKKK